MSNISIGIAPRWNRKDNKINPNTKYLDYLSQGGFEGKMLPYDLKDDLKDLKSKLDSYDGFLIPGGIDMNPKLFNEEIDGTRDYDDHLDAIDYAIIDYAIKHKKPLLGICRGHQVINVFLGGTLYQDIGKDHQDTHHQVITTPSALITFPDEIEVNSYHHQAVKVLGKSLHSVATSKQDNYNEAYISCEYPILCVQWHPEKESDKETSKIILDAFKNMFK